MRRFAYVAAREKYAVDALVCLFTLNANIPNLQKLDLHHMPLQCWTAWSSAAAMAFLLQIAAAWSANTYINFKPIVENALEVSLSAIEKPRRVSASKQCRKLAGRNINGKMPSTCKASQLR